MVIPEEPILLICDEAARNIKADVFFCPQFRSYCCFQELCKLVQGGQVPINTDIVVIWFGIGQVFRYRRVQIVQNLQKLIANIQTKRNEVQIFVSTLVPLPQGSLECNQAVLKMNDVIMELAKEWTNQARLIHLLVSHSVFARKTEYLDEVTGILMQQYMFHPGALKEFQGGAINNVGWFKLRKFWLQEIMEIGIPEEVKLAGELDLPQEYWKTPKTVLDLDDSMDSIE